MFRKPEIVVITVNIMMFSEISVSCVFNYDRDFCIKLFPNVLWFHNVVPGIETSTTVLSSIVPTLSYRKNNSIDCLGYNVCN